MPPVCVLRLYVLDLGLVTGTLRPDLIESASELVSGKAEMIKTHHNDTELVRQLRKQVCAVVLTTDSHCLLPLLLTPCSSVWLPTW